MPFLIPILTAIGSAAGTAASAIGTGAAAAGSTAASALGSLGSAIGSGASAAGSALEGAGSSALSGLESAGSSALSGLESGAQSIGHALGLGGESATQGMSASDIAALKAGGIEAVPSTATPTAAESSMMLGGTPYNAVGGLSGGSANPEAMFASQGSSSIPTNWSQIGGSLGNLLGGGGGGGGGGGKSGGLGGLLGNDPLMSMLKPQLAPLQPAPTQGLGQWQTPPIAGDDPSVWMRAFHVMG